MSTKILNGIALFLMSLLIFFSLVIYVPKFLGLSVYYVETDSMAPTLNVGDAVFVKAVPFEDVLQNDIITFSNETNTKFCTHRVVSVNEKAKSFITKGDHNSVRDPFATEYQYIKGKVVFKISAIGFLFRILNTNVARVSVVVLAVVLFSVEIEIFRIKKKGGRQK